MEENHQKITEKHEKIESNEIWLTNIHANESEANKIERMGDTHV